MKKMLIFSFLFLAIVCMAFQKKQVQPYKIIYSKSLNMFSQEQGKFTRLEGDVHFFYGEIEFFCDIAEITENTQEAKLFGNVKVIDDTLTISSQKLFYNHKTEVIEVKTKGILTQTNKTTSDKRIFKAEYINYDRKNGILIAKNNVYNYDSKEKSTLTAGFLHYDFNKEYGYLLKNPRVSINKTDSLTIDALKIEIFKDKQKVVGSFNTYVEGKDFTINSDFFILYKQQEKAIFTGNPIFKSNFFDAYAKQFTLTLKDDKINNASLRDSCKVLFASKENGIKINTVTAKEIDILFKNSKINICNARINVKTKFDASKQKERFTNVANGDSLHINFDINQNLRKLGMKGKVSGTYKFYNKSIDTSKQNK